MPSGIAPTSVTNRLRHKIDASVLKVGDLLYRRAYAGSAPMDWVSFKIVNETPRTWIVKCPREHSHVTIVGKSTLRTSKNRNGYFWQFYTKAGSKDRDFCTKWAGPIASAVGVVQDGAILRQIAELIGKKLDD